MASTQRKKSNLPLEDNMKKAMTELLILHLLSKRDYYIGELTATLSEQSNGVLNIVFPYSAVYRLQQAGYIDDIEKRIATDGRRRQYFAITEKGREYHSQLLDLYKSFSASFDVILEIER